MNTKWSKWCLTLFLLAALSAWGETRISIDGTLEWDKREINAVISLDLAAANIKLPAGRTQGESLISSEYLRLLRPAILDIQADSSSTLGDCVSRGELSLTEAEAIALKARIVPPFLSPDLRNLSASYTLNLEEIGAALIRHRRPAEIRRILNPLPVPAYTGIIIIASESLPVHGMKSSALPLPCLFPKIWDTDMNLIYERNMLEPGRSAMIRYAPTASIFTSGPSGLAPEITALVGENPLRIIARGVFGAKPTDPVIDREDALAIISSEENRSLLREGRVVIIVDEAVLRSRIGGADGAD